MADPASWSRGRGTGAERCVPALGAAAEWFLRLNGFFTVLNFIVHPLAAGGTNQRTDADVLGIRFPGREEVVGGRPVVDHPSFADATRPLFAIAEAKRGVCRINGPWSRPHQGNVANVLRSCGIFGPGEFGAVAEALYAHGAFESGEFDARLICFGASRSAGLPEGAVQFTWDEVFRFIHGRCQAFWSAKRQNQQWPPVGRFFWDAASKCDDGGAYVQRMLKTFGVRQSGAGQQPGAAGHGSSPA